jgi:hypothetical protein
MALVDSYNTLPPSTYYAVYAARWRAQTFTASTDYTIGSVKLYGYRYSNTYDHTVALYATDAGLPTGNPLATAAVSSGSVPDGVGNVDWYEAVFDTPYALSSGVVYAIVVYVDGGAGDSSHYLALGYISSDVYASGSYCASNDSGSSWSAPVAWDFLFETYDVSISYVDGSATMAGVSTFAATGTVVGFKDASATMAGTSVFAATGAVTRTSTGIQNNPGRTLRRLVAINNNCLYYEDI